MTIEDAIAYLRSLDPDYCNREQLEEITEIADRVDDAAAYRLASLGDARDPERRVRFSQAEIIREETKELHGFWKEKAALSDAKDKIEELKKSLEQPS